MSAAIPRQLADAFAEGRVILFVGAGMSMPQLPGWEKLLRDMLASGVDGRAAAILKAEKRIRACIDSQKFLEAARLLREGMGPRDFCAFLGQRLRGVKGDSRHQIAARMPFAAMLTTNFDTLLEDAFGARPDVLNQQKLPELMQALQRRRFCVVHVHGEVTDSQSVVLAAADYKALKQDKQFAHYVDNLSSQHMLLFVGYGLQDEDLLLFLSQAFEGAGGHAGPHYAFVHPSAASHKRNAEYQSLYGIRFLANDSGGKHPDIERFLLTLEATLPVPADLATDVEALLEEWGCTDLVRVPSEGRLLFKATRVDEFGEEKHAALGYVNRSATAEDFAALKEIKHAELRVLITPKKARLNDAEVRTFSRDEILNQLIRFDRYLPAIETAYNTPAPDRLEDAIEKYYVPLKVRRTAKHKPEELDDLVEEWLAEAKGERRHLSILGEFGTGKSWFARRLNYRAASAMERKRVPILFQLRNWSERFDLKGLITDTLVNTHKLRLASDYRAFERLNAEGRLLLIFDGFDEMVRNANNPRTAKENFEAIATLAKPERAKVLLTCRTEYFSTEKDVEKTILGRHEAIKTKEDWIEGRHGFECVYLQLFDDGQLRDALKRRDAEGLLPKLKKFKALEEFAHRPVLLDMVLKTQDQWKAKKRVTLTDLYLSYTEGLLELRKDEEITSDERRVLIEDAAWRMQSQQRFQMSSEKEFEEIVLARHPGAKREEVTRRMLDLRSQSSYFRREGDVFTFAHKSFLEYFVARQVARQLKVGQKPAVPLTDVIVEFLPDLLAGRVKYVVERDGKGMVRVPKGCFVYGNEEEKNLQVAEIEEDFWIDENPVTNQEYLAFLEGSGAVDAKWIEFQWSRIKSDSSGALSIEAGYERHPVVGVTWYGAEAYAKAYGKQLPTELQWEKAARGVDGREYPWFGVFSKSLCDVRSKGTTEIGSYAKGASPYGP